MALDSSVVMKGARDASVTLSSFPAPVYIDIVPPTGSTSGGTAVTIGGSHFSGATGVTIGGVALTSFTVVSDTQITGVTGAHGAGAVDVVITGRVGTATGVAAFSYASGFDPATLSPTGWWRSSYTADPWAGQGSSGNLANGGSSAPAVGAAVNGFTPPDFNGSTQYLSHASDFSTFVGAAAGTILVAFYARSATAAAANTYDDPGFVTDTNNGFNLGFSSGGVGIALYDGAWQQHRLACSSGAYHLAKLTWNGATLSIGVDNGAMSSFAAGSYVPSAGSKLTVGKTAISAVKFFDGQILDILLKNAVLTGTDIDNYRTYLNARYGISV